MYMGLRATSIDANFTRYTAAAGIPEAREAICARYKDQYGVDITAAEVLLTAGGKQALFNTALSLYNPGDEVITHAPYWPTIPEQVKLVGATPIIVPTRSDEGFAVHADAVVAAITPRTKAIILNSPCNPTGALVDEATLTPIVEAAAKRGIWIVVDLCYEQLIYEPVPHNLVKVLFDRHRDRTVIAGSASKSYAMTGWRCGWTIAPKELTSAFNTIQGQTTSNITSITQKAALAAISGPQDAVVAMLDEDRKRRDNIHAWLTAHPAIRCVKPSGAFYLFPDISALLSPDGPPHVGRFRAGTAREGARRGNRRRGIRRARLPSDLVRDVDGGSPRRRYTPAALCRVLAAGKGRLNGGGAALLEDTSPAARSGLSSKYDLRPLCRDRRRPLRPD